MWYCYGGGEWHDINWKCSVQMQIKAASSLWTVCCWMLAKVIWRASHGSLGVERTVWELKVVCFDWVNLSQISASCWFKYYNYLNKASLKRKRKILCTTSAGNFSLFGCKISIYCKPRKCYVFINRFCSCGSTFTIPFKLGKFKT